MTFRANSTSGIDEQRLLVDYIMADGDGDNAAAPVRLYWIAWLEQNGDALDSEGDEDRQILDTLATHGAYPREGWAGGGAGAAWRLRLVEEPAPEPFRFVPGVVGKRPEPA